MEIVTRPDMRSSEEAAAFLRKLRAIVRYLGTCDGNMDEGSMRADVNVSVCRPGGYEEFRRTGSFKTLGTRCEIKNVNSMRFIAQAVEYEARRQIEVIEEGGAIPQETRLFDSGRGVTRPMRSKEEAHDYRYFPDPDLLPLELDAAWVERLKRELPELPDAKRARFVTQYGLSPYEAGVLVDEQASALYFETVAKGRDAKLACNWVMGDLFGALNKRGLEIARSPVAAVELGALLDLIRDGTISGRIAKDVFAAMLESGKSAAAIVEEKGLRQVTDAGAIEQAVSAVLAKEPDKVAEYRAGREKLLGYFVGQVMKATGGKANPGLVNELLKKKLAG